MNALGALPPAHGIAAMQSINRVIVNALFLVVFLGTGVLCAAIGGVLYLAGSVLVTMVFNVPRNNALAAGRADAVALWRDYLARWTAWNHVRCIASFGATACFVFALMRAS